MPMKIDHGLVVIENQADGTKTVSICAEVVNGVPTNTYARYFNAKVKVQPEVALLTHGSRQFTNRIAEVSEESGVVLVRYPHYA